jgi:hypothetical protein
MGRRTPVPHALAAIDVVSAELEVLRAAGFTPEQKAAAAAAKDQLGRATRAATGQDPTGGRAVMWWRGTQVETAYQSLHAARVSMISVYGPADLMAELPRALARAQSSLHPDDPRRLGVTTFKHKDERSTRAFLRRLVEDGYEASDQQYTRLRNFRNIVYLSCLAVLIVLGATLLVVTREPDLLPLCFTGSDPETFVCPSGEGAVGPSASDIWIVALMGLVGGALSAVVNIRSLRGTSTPYDAPVALALLKMPLGALTAVVGLVLVRGQFIPGLSDLDSQGQILAYAVLFGVAQHVLTRLVDQKAQALLNGLPAKDPESSPGSPVKDGMSFDVTYEDMDATSEYAPAGGADADESAPLPGDVGPSVPIESRAGEFDELTSGFQPNPYGDDEPQVQDDEAAPIADVTELDHA